MLGDKGTKVAVISLGCAKNLADMEGVLAGINPELQLVPYPDAEIVFLNTCGFLKEARDEVYENLKMLTKKKVIFMGCLAGTIDKSFFEKYPQVCAIVSSANYLNIDEIFQEVLKGEKVFAVSPEPTDFEVLPGKQLLTSQSYAYVKIAEGCDNSCSYCLIPKLKGKYRSRKKEQILQEVEALVNFGVKEIILVAQDCGYYGVDLYGEMKLAELLEEITSINGDFWVRVLYVYPERINDELLKVLNDSKKICKYLDIPLQHGDRSILKKMKRVSDVAKIKENIKNIREKVPGIVLRTSFIVGFPGETEKEFLNLAEFVSDIEFDHVGVFKYSKEKGTAAYDFKGDVTKENKDERFNQLMTLQQKISLRKNRELEGKVVQVLVDHFDTEKKMYIGRSMRFAPEVDGEILIKSEKKLEQNMFYDVKITEGKEYDLLGEVK